MAFNIMSGCMNEEKKERGNALLRACKKSHDGLNAGRKEYRESVFNERGAYDPTKDSGQYLTGYQQQERDPFSASAQFAEAGAAQGVSFNHDALTSAAAQNVSVDARTGVTTVCEDLYGKVDYGPLGRSFGESALALVGSVADTFCSAEQMTTPNQAMYACSGHGLFDSGGGLFANFNAQTAAFSGTFGACGAEARDHFGRTIQTDLMGRQFVEEGTRRWEVGLFGNQTEVNPLTGQALETANQGWTGWGMAASEPTQNTPFDFHAIGGTNQAAVSIHSSYTQPAETCNIWGSTTSNEHNTFFGSINQAQQDWSNTIWNTTCSTPAQTANIYSTYETSSGNDPMAHFYGNHRKNDWA